MTRHHRRRLVATAALAVTAVSVAAFPVLAQDGEVGTGGASGVDVAERAGAGWSDCSNVMTDDRPITGGCVAYAQLDARFRIVTPFGAVRFADCTLGFDAHIDNNGEVALYGVAAGGASPCGDIRTCRLDTDTERQPWLGEIAAVGPDSFRLRLDACMDTCAGWFEGPLDLDLRRSGAGWRLRADRAQLGFSGLEIDGAAPFEPRRPLRITASEGR